MILEIKILASILKQIYYKNDLDRGEKYFRQIMICKVKMRTKPEAQFQKTGLEKQCIISQKAYSNIYYKAEKHFKEALDSFASDTKFVSMTLVERCHNSPAPTCNGVLTSLSHARHFSIKQYKRENIP